MFSLFCKSCHQCPTCCYRSSCRGKATPMLGEMGSSGFESKSSHHTEGGLHPPLPVQTQLDKVTDCNKQLPQLSQAVLPFRSTVSADKQKCSQTGRKSKLTGFLQPAIFGTQTQQPVETGPGPEHLEHLFKHRVVQNGDPRDNKNLPTGRGVGHIHRLQRRILPYTNSQSVKEVHAFSPQGRSYQFKALPFGLSTAPMEFTVVAKEVKLMALQRGIRIHQYLDDWLVRASTHDTCLQHTQTLVALCQDLGLLVNKEKLELVPKQVFNFVGYQFDLKEGKVRPTTERWQTLTDKIRSILPGPTVHVRHRPTHSNRKTSPPRVTPYAAHTVACEKQLEGPRVTRKGDPGPQVTPPPSKMVAGGKQCASRSTITPSKTCFANIYRCIKRRVGRSLRRAHCKGNLVPSGKQVAHKPLRAKSSISSSKRVLNPLLQQDSTDCYRQHNSGCLYQQRGGDEIGLSVCPTVENPVLVYQTRGNPQSTSHPRPAERDSRQAIRTWPDHSNRVVTSSRSVPSYMLPVAPAPSGPVCHQIQQQTSTV